MNFILDAFLPNLCMSCKKVFTKTICCDCEYSIKLNLTHSFLESHYLDSKIEIISLSKYEGEIKQLISKIKFEFRYQLGEYLGALVNKRLYESLNRVINNYDYFVYVPIHSHRLRMRGFNQVELIFSNVMGQLPIKELCMNRIKSTAPLFDKSLEERQLILNDSFELIPDNHTNIEGSGVLIIDDIVTTGSTINEIKKVLDLNGVGNVSVLCLAR